MIRLPEQYQLQMIWYGHLMLQVCVLMCANWTVPDTFMIRRACSGHLLAQTFQTLTLYTLFKNGYLKVSCLHAVLPFICVTAKFGGSICCYKSRFSASVCYFNLQHVA